jgi:hypothetical protein
VANKKPSEPELILPKPKRMRVDDATASEKAEKPYTSGGTTGRAGGRGAKGEGGTVGRPVAEIDEKTMKLIRDLSSIGCPVAEIAYATKIPLSTLKKNWQYLINEGRMGANISVRKKQFNKAMAGDNTMLIWYGKQHMGQSDAMKVNNVDDTPPQKTQLVVEFV